MEKVLFAVVRVPDEAVPLGCVEILHAALERDDLLRFRPAGYRDLDLRCVDLLAFPDFGRCRVKNAVFIHISQHLLEIAAELPDLVIRPHIHRKIQITVLNVLRRHLQLLDRIDKTCINPYGQHTCCQD